MSKHVPERSFTRYPRWKINDVELFDAQEIAHKMCGTRSQEVPISGFPPNSTRPAVGLAYQHFALTVNENGTDPPCSGEAAREAKLFPQMRSEIGLIAARIRVFYFMQGN